MIDIDTELNAIANADGGEVVRRAIARAAESVANGEGQTDITQELITIRTGRYGYDIRMAIHDALRKLANSSDPFTNYQVITAVIFEQNPVINECIVGKFEQVNFEEE